MSALLFPHSTLLQIRAYSLVPLSVITHLKEGQMEVLNVVHTYCNLLSSLARACVARSRSKMAARRAPIVLSRSGLSSTLLLFKTLLFSRGGDPLNPPCCPIAYSSVPYCCLIHTRVSYHVTKHVKHSPRTAGRQLS